MNTPFLDPAEIRHNCAEAGLNDAAAQQFINLAARIAQTPALLDIAQAAHHQLFDARADSDDPAFKQADAAFGNEASAFRALLVLDSIRLIRERQAARGMPADISRAVMAHHPIGVLQECIEKGEPAGVDAWIWDWYSVVGSGDLHQLGRLEFYHKRWDYPCRVFLNDATREIVVMLDAGVRLTDDGYRVGELTWESQCDEDDATIISHAVSPLGFVVRQPVKLAKAAWRLALSAGDVVLDLHIPGDTPLTLDAIRDAMQRSESFFDHYYPGNPFNAWVCDSWLFSPQLRHMLPAESNIVRWQNECYLLPNDSGPDDFLNFVFGASSIDPATAPRDTRLRRAALDHIARGMEPLRSGHALFLRHDLPRFGTQPYRVSSEQAIGRLVQEV